MPVALSHQLFQHLCSHNLLPSPLLQKFGRLNITSPVHGLYSTKFPLWKLGYFLEEEWLQDEVLDGLAELVYFQAGANSVHIGASPSALYLPTAFMNEARILFHEKGTRQYSPELQALRERIQRTNVNQIGFLDYSTNHYSSYMLEAFCVLQHGDSMHRDPASDVVPILQWVFSGLSIGGPISVQPGFIDRQGRGGGDGSCGIAAHNFIACAIDPTVSRWMAPSSREVRNSLLRELCIYNDIASEAAGVCILFKFAFRHLTNISSPFLIGWSPAFHTSFRHVILVILLVC